jgi:hypothetical protein
LVLKVYCDFNDRTADERYWILSYNHQPLGSVAAALGLADGDRVILFQDEGDFEVEATLLFNQNEPEAFFGSLLCAKPDWETLRRL